MRRGLATAVTVGLAGRVLLGLRRSHLAQCHLGDDDRSSDATTTTVEPTTTTTWPPVADTCTVSVTLM